VGLTNPHLANNIVTHLLLAPRTLTDSFYKRPKRRNMDMRLGTWNVRSLYRADSLVIDRLWWCGLDWSGSGYEQVESSCEFGIEPSGS
jgi:hypothetical protein